MTQDSVNSKQRRAQSAVEKAFNAIENFLHIESTSGIVLLIAAASALIWANSPAAASYEHLWHLPLSFSLGDFSVSQSLHFWINDALMTIFFLVVGMEIRKEMHDGSLANVKLAILPVVAAIGGVIFPALIYFAINSDEGVRHGWAVPTATDIAFAVGVLALLGNSIPGSVRIFLLALAIIDDLFAIMIIALFYSEGLDLFGFVIAGGGIALVLLMQFIGIGSAWAYVLPGAILWFGMLKTGAHPTLAGVVLGLMTPVMSTRSNVSPPVVRVQTSLHPWVAYGIMPLFALANAGVSLGGFDLANVSTVTVMLGVALALILGKPIGIISISWLCVRLGWSRLPEGMTWKWLCLIGCLAGIGFTMSIFIANLAFTDMTLLNAAKLGVLLASAAAGVIGLLLGRMLVARAKKSN